MNIYKCYAPTNCRCRKNYGFGAQWRNAYCLSCGSSFAAISQSKQVTPTLLAIIRDHEVKIVFGSKDCPNKIGFMFEDSDNYALCTECGYMSEISTKIDKPLGEFILNIINTE